MAKELYGNIINSYLSAACASTDTTITVANGAVFPTGGQFTIRCESEYMLCTGISTNTLTVTRGVDGSTAAAHTQGAVVFVALTDGSLRRLARQTLNGTNQTARREVNWKPQLSVGMAFADDATNDKVDVTLTSWGPLVAPVPPPTTGWTVFGSNAAFTQDLGSTFPAALMLKDTGAASASNLLRGVYRSVPATPFHIIVSFLHTYPIGSGNEHAGLVWTDGTKFHTFSIASSSGSPQIDAFRFTNNTTYAGTNDFNQIGDMFWFRFLRLGDDGTNLTWSISADGVNFFTVLSQSRTTFFTAGPTGIGLYLCCSAAVAQNFSCVHWQATG